MSDRENKTIVTDHGEYAEPALHPAEFVGAVWPSTHAAQGRLIEDQPLGALATEATADLSEEVDDEGRNAPLALST